MLQMPSPTILSLFVLPGSGLVRTLLETTQGCSDHSTTYKLRSKSSKTLCHNRWHNVQ